MKARKAFIAAGILIVLTVALAVPAGATTLSEVLSGIADARKPVGLTTLTFMGDMRLDLNTETGLLPEQVSLFAAWRAPGDWFCSYESGGELAGSLDEAGGGHPSVNHVLLSRPDFLDVLDMVWVAQYQGTALWDGEPAWQLLFSTRDLTLDVPPFQLYVRKDDLVPLRASATFDDGTVATTDFSWIVVDEIIVPAKFTTRFEPAVGPLSGFETTYFNHEVNTDLSGVNFPREEGTLLSINEPEGESPPVFEELYHGFADDPIVAPINDSSGTYDRLSFTFSLYVESESVFGELNGRRQAIRTLAGEIVSEWDWSGDDGLSTPGGKYECGMEIMTAIGELLDTDAITDFYFLDFDPLEPGDEE